MKRRSEGFRPSLLLGEVVEVVVEVEAQQQQVGYTRRGYAPLAPMVPRMAYAPVHLPDPQDAKLQPRA